MTTKYEQVYEGEPIEVPKTWIISCCDCGLVHRLEFTYIKPKGKKRQKLMVTVFCGQRAHQNTKEAKGAQMPTAKTRRKVEWETVNGARRITIIVREAGRLGTTQVSLTAAELERSLALLQHTQKRRKKIDPEWAEQW